MNVSRRVRQSVSVCVIPLSFLFAQDDFDKTGSSDVWSSKAFSPHVLLQAGTSFRLGKSPASGSYPNAITAHTSRLQIRGSFDSGFDYYVQWSFISNPALLDTRIGYRVSPALAFDIGMFKTPAGMEFLTATEHTDLISGASLLRFGPKRDGGVQARVNLSEQIELRGGFFNGTGSFLNGDNTDLLSMLRVSFFSPSSEGYFAAGLSAGLDPQTQGGGSFEFFESDIRVESSGYLLAVEAAYERRSPGSLAPVSKTYGWYLTAGVPIAERTGVKARYQRVSVPLAPGPEDDLILNIGHTPDDIFSLSLELIVPVKHPSADPPPMRILTQVQMYL